MAAPLASDAHDLWPAASGRRVRRHPSTDSAALRESLGEDAARGWLLALGFAVTLSAARFIDVTVDGKAMHLFAIGYGAAIALTSVTRPLWYLLLAIAYLPFAKVYPVTLVGITGVNMSNLLLAFGPIAWLTARNGSSLRLRVGALELLVVLYVALVTLSLAPAYADGDGLGETLQTYRGWLAPVLFFFIARGVLRDRQGVRASLVLMAVVAFLVGGLTWWEGIQRGGRGSIEAARVGGVMDHANTMGAFIVYYAVLLLALGLRERSWPKRVLYVAGFLVAARAMLYTFSRAAYLALATGSSLVAVLHSPVLFAAGGAAAVAAAVANPELIPDSVRTRFGHTTNTTGLAGENVGDTLDRSTVYRLIIWDAAFKMIRERPLVGVGLGRFPYVVGYYTDVQLSRNDPNDAHNAFLLIAAENGLPALAVAVLFLTALGFTAARVYFRHRHPTHRVLALGLLGTLGGLGVSCMLGSRFSDEALIAYFWILAGMMAVVARLPGGRPGAARRLR